MLDDNSFFIIFYMALSFCGKVAVSFHDYAPSVRTKTLQIRSLARMLLQDGLPVKDFQSKEACLH